MKGEEQDDRVESPVGQPRAAFAPGFLQGLLDVEIDGEINGGVVDELRSTQFSEVLRRAVEAHDATEVRRLLATQPLLIARPSPASWCALHEAARQCDAPMVEALLQFANVNEADQNANTALHIAVRAGYGAGQLRGSRRVVRLLLSGGADSSARNELGETALALVCFLGDSPTVGLLLQHGRATLRRTCDALGRLPLHHAVAHGHKIVVSQLLGAEAAEPVANGGDMHCEDKSGCTPFVLAVQSGMHAIVQAMAGSTYGRACIDTVWCTAVCSSKALPPHCSDSGENDLTALHYAVLACDAPMVRALLYRGRRGRDLELGMPARVVESTSQAGCCCSAARRVPAAVTVAAAHRGGTLVPVWAGILARGPTQPRADWDSSLRRPLEVAVALGCPEVVRALLDGGESCMCTAVACTSTINHTNEFGREILLSYPSWRLN